MSDKKIIEPAPDTVALRFSVIERCLIEQDERLIALGLQLAADIAHITGLEARDAAEQGDHR